MIRNIDQLISLRGRVAMVTGGGGRLGRVICETLAELGADVAVLDLPGTGVDELAEKLAVNCQVRTLGFDLDLTDDTAVRHAPARVAELLGPPDILVNNAAFVGDSNLMGWVVPFPEQSIETWRAAIDVNLTAAFAMCQAALPFLAQRSRGSIINIASIYGVLGPDWSLYQGINMGNPAAYAASKGGLIQFSRWLATTVAPEVRVNVISPGGIARGQPEEFVKRYASRTPLGRMATEEDLKGIIALLASDASAYLTGQNIMIDGGWSAW